MSLPALINRLPRPVTGKFEEEVAKRDLLRADIVIMDIHWYLSIHSAIKLSHRIKAVNPRASIIAGGLSASIFFKQILRDSQIDYIVRGDAELPLQALVEAILNRADISQVPNTAGRNFCSQHWYALTAADMDASDYCGISFFPALEKDIFNIHRNSRGYPRPAYPFLTTFRGCPLSCNMCYGAPRLQHSLFKRSMVLRSKERVKADLIRWSNNPRISFVNIYHDFVTLLPSAYTEHILRQHYNLTVHYEFSRLPSEQDLNLLTSAFTGGIIIFPLDQNHATSEELCNIQQLIERIRQVRQIKRFEVRLAYVKRFALRNSKYRNSLAEIQKATRCAITAADSWWQNAPMPNTEGLCKEKNYLYFKKQYNRYALTNALFHGGLFLHKYFPGLVNYSARGIRRFF